MTAADAAVCQCGHRRDLHDDACWSQIDGDCPCAAFVADVNRPDGCEQDHVNGPVTYVTCTRCGEDALPHCRDCGYDLYGHFPCDEAEPVLAAVPDREGATEQLAALLAAHERAKGFRDMREHCVCGWISRIVSDDHPAHVAAVIVAAGWEKR
jgi:hypothetical protein